MPTYSFECSECKHFFEKMNSITKRNDPLMTPCPKCGKLKLERKIVPQGGVLVVDGINLGRKPVDGGFQEVLAKIHENTPGSNLNQLLSRNPNAFR